MSLTEGDGTTTFMSTGAAKICRFGGCVGGPTPKAISSPGGKMERVAKLLSQIENSDECSHAYRIRRAKEAIDILNGFIASEVRSAVNTPRGKVSNMSWAEIAKALDISKSAAFARYGKK